jgi:MYXO-CTERM domain-containing protein
VILARRRPLSCTTHTELAVTIICLQKGFEMNRRLALTLISLMLLSALTTVSHAAITMYSDRSLWEAAVPSFADVDLAPYFLPGYPYNNTNSVLLPALAAPAATLNFDVTLSVRQIGDGWYPATGDGWLSISPAPYILWTGSDPDSFLGAASATGTFDAPVFGFGLEMEPNEFSSFDMTLDLGGGNSLTQTVDMLNGVRPKFFGFWGDVGVTGWTASIDTTLGGFAMGRLVVAGPEDGGDGHGSPELSTWMLLACSGLAGLAFRRRRRS